MIHSTNSIASGHNGRDDKKIANKKSVSVKDQISDLKGWIF